MLRYVWVDDTCGDCGRTTQKGYVEIPIANYRSVNNFAKKFDFCYTESALETIKQYKKEQREMRRVKVDK